MGNCIRIERLENGFTVEMDDPKIIEANNKRDNSSNKGPYVPWKDPSRKFTFGTNKAVVAFITKNIDKIIPKPKDDFVSSFEIAAKDSDDG
jgi:hypothetical protein